VSFGKQHLRTVLDHSVSAPGERQVCMIVEDEAVIAMALEDELEGAGFKICGPFATCAAALMTLERASPHVAVLDAILRDGPCLELARELKKRGIPFVMYSGREEAHRNAPELAHAPWIAKPALHWDVVRAVRKLMPPMAQAALDGYTPGATNASDQVARTA
jgi:DNA-binding response OmpR family regulator